MSSMIEDLERLTARHEEGASTDEEFAAGKERVVTDGPGEGPGRDGFWKFVSSVVSRSRTHGVSSPKNELPQVNGGSGKMSA